MRRQVTLNSEILTTAPTARSWAAMAVLVPGIVTQAGASADIQVTPQMTVFGGMGGRGNEGRMQVDGLNTGAALNGGGVSTYVADISNASEVVTTTSGGLGEAEVGGPTLSIVPRSGGNKTSGSIYLSGVPDGFVASNYSDELKNAGLSTPGSLIKQWDFTGGVGGPIVRDRIWYYATARDEGQHRTIPGIFPNLNAGKANAVGLRARHQPAGPRRRELPDLHGPIHRAGVASATSSTCTGSGRCRATAPRSAATATGAATSPTTR